MPFVKMIDMAKTPEEIKEDIAETAMPVAAPDKVPSYPWGLCITLDEDSLAKLGIDEKELPDVGDMIHLFAMAKVTSASQNEREDKDGNKTVCKRIELQITHMGLEDEDREAGDMGWYDAGEEKAEAAA